MDFLLKFGGIKNKIIGRIKKDLNEKNSSFKPSLKVPVVLFLIPSNFYKKNPPFKSYQDQWLLDLFLSSHNLFPSTVSLCFQAQGLEGKILSQFLDDLQMTLDADSKCRLFKQFFPGFIKNLKRRI